MSATSSLWRTVKTRRYAPARESQSFDVVVVGAGITGLTAAYLLQEAGKRVAVVERYGLGAGDTGNTTAHLAAVPDVWLTEVVRNFGKESARLLCQGKLSAISTIEAIAAGDCEFERVPGYLHASLDHDRDERAAFEREAQLGRECGLQSTFETSVPYFAKPGIRYDQQAKFHPFKYLNLLADAVADGDGCAIFCDSDVTKITDKPLAAVVNDRVALRCDYLVFATHVPLIGRAGFISATLFQSKLAPYTSYAVGARIPGGVIPHGLYWDTSDPYYYTRVESRTGGDYLIFGGCDHKTGQVVNESEQFDKLRTRCLEIVPQAKIDRQWSGQVVETNDGLPYIGETAERQFVATGFSGNGMTYGTLAATMACDRVLGRDNPWSDLFSVNRVNLRGSAWDYLRENFDYPYYLLRDRFAPADTKSVDDVHPGEGKIVSLHGDRVACSRSADGTLTTVSAICTHMGCQVRWNGAEQTWDCPCHGSRFRADGEVLAGPAETPLEAVDIEARSSLSGS